MMDRRSFSLFAAAAFGHGASLAGERATPLREFPPLSESLRRALDAVPPSGGRFEPVYYPCQVTLLDGTELDRVYLTEAQRWFRTWGTWPQDDAGKKAVDVGSIASLRESPSRLPAAFANKLYEAGESGMGFTIFTVRYRDGTHSAFAAGGAVDFVEYPAGKSAADVVDVQPHEGRRDPARRDAPDYYWALFS